jgi:hypothetical protein
VEYQPRQSFLIFASNSGYGKFNYLLNLLAIPAASSTVFDISTMSYILPSAECDLNLSNLDKGILNAVVFGGKTIHS